MVVTVAAVALSQIAKTLQKLDWKFGEIWQILLIKPATVWQILNTQVHAVWVPKDYGHQQPCYVLPPNSFGGKYNLIQIHRQIIHQSDGISIRNWLKSSPPAFFIWNLKLFFIPADSRAKLDLQLETMVLLFLPLYFTCSDWKRKYNLNLQKLAHIKWTYFWRF